MAICRVEDRVIGTTLNNTFNAEVVYVISAHNFQSHQVITKVDRIFFSENRNVSKKKKKRLNISKKNFIIDDRNNKYPTLKLCQVYIISIITKPSRSS